MDTSQQTPGIQRNTPLAIIGLLVGIVYVALPYDIDSQWWGYIDDFFVFMAGYTFFMGQRSRSIYARRLLLSIAGAFFIIGMLALIALVLFT